MSNQVIIRDLTTGKVSSLLLKFALPLFLSNALQAVYNIVDMVVVGQFIGGAGMSAVSIGGDILHLLTFVAMGFSSAGQVLIAKDVGAGDLKSVKHTIGTMFTFLLIASLAISGICFFIKEPMLELLNTPAESFDYTLDYTVTCLLGLVFIYGYNIVCAILRGMGDSRHPFVFIVIAAIINIILDVVFVAFLDMAVFGAALATVIAQGVSFIISMIFLYQKRDSFCFDFKLSSFAIHGPSFQKILALGIPMAIQSAAVSLSKVVLMAWINLYGVTYSALAGVFNKVNTISAIISNSFTTAGSAMVGQNLGAKKDERIPQILMTVFVCSLIILALLSLIIVLFPDTVFSAFTSDADVLAIASVIIGPVLLNFLGSVTRSVAFSIINGSGHVRLNLAVALIDGICARIGLAALFGFALGLDCAGIWYGDALAGFVPIAIGMTFYLSGHWRTRPK